jgi:hypothetical protein
MKKLLLIVALLIPFTSAYADHERREYREHREWHEQGNHFGWGEFVGGLILGGIIAHEVNGRYYDTDEHEVRRITTCYEYPVVDQYGHYVYDDWGHLMTERRCRDEWVRVRR